MMWLEKAMRGKAPQISPIENNPVGWSSTYAPEVLTNPSPEFSPLASAMMMTNEQKLGRFWNAATGRAKIYTNADLPQLTAAGNEAYDAAAGFVGMATPIKAYHGSPHTFDRFDLSKIGTGEGAQAYGHGLYFAGAEDVAKTYRMGTPQPIVKADVSPSVNTQLTSAIYHGGDLDGAKAWLQKQIGIQERSLAKGASDPQTLSYYLNSNKTALEHINAGKVQIGPAPGSMYEVSLRTTPERLLDWDKPLSQQPAAVREALGNIAPQFGDNLRGSLPAALAKPGGIADTQVATGEKAYRELIDAISRRDGNPTFYEIPQGKAVKPSLEGASDALRQAGIDGIQYLDAGSRAAGEGSRNYVMFDDKLIDILRRYGLLGMMGGGAAATVGGDQ